MFFMFYTDNSNPTTFYTDTTNDLFDTDKSKSCFHVETQP